MGIAATEVVVATALSLAEVDVAGAAATLL